MGFDIFTNAMANLVYHQLSVINLKGPHIYIHLHIYKPETKWNNHPLF